MNINNKEYWDLPGGKVKFGESPFDTLKREVKEEVGLEVEISRSLDMYWFFGVIDKFQVVCYTFLCRPLTKNVDISKNPAEEDKIVEFGWVSKEEFLGEEYPVIHESLKELILKL